MNREPFISVIVPVHNGGLYLDRCLDALRASFYRAFEIIVVDDASTDGSGEIGRRKGDRVFHLSRRSGPAAARNLGARRARGEILLFTDSDVLVKRETLSRVAAVFLRYPGSAVVFGSYDDHPAEENLVSQYKNLYHHFVHQRANTEGVTFWAGCGAIRREAFEAVGGFDERRYTRPAIEDIELGYRLRRQGYRIVLDHELQVTHLKRWTLPSLLRADIFSRALPWSKLILESRELINDLNLRVADRVSAALVGLAFGSLALALVVPRSLFAVPILLAVVLGLNQQLYSFFLRRRGPKFVVGAFGLQLLYYCYSGTVFVLCLCLHVCRRKKQAASVDGAESYR